MVSGQNKPQTLNYNISKKTNMYTTCFPSLLPVLKKNLETLFLYRGHVRQFL